MPGVTEHLRFPIFPLNRSQPPLAGPASRNLRGQVAFSFGGSAHVGQQQRHHVPLEPSVLENLDWWNPQPLLINLSRGPHRARQRPANIGVVRPVRCVERRPSASRQIHRHHHSEIRQMSPAGKGIVEYHHIPWSQGERPARRRH